MTRRRSAVPAGGIRTATVAVTRSLVGLLCWVLIGAGCGRTSGLDVRTVTGTVTVDGAPLNEGRITLTGLTGDTRGFSARIERGKYRIEAFPGRARVAITALREVPGETVSGGPGSPAIPRREQFIPDRYNANTELEADIPPAGIRGLDFELTTKNP